MSCSNAFDGAQVNLKRIISCRLKEGNRNNPTHDAVRVIRTCIESFREAIYLLLFSSSATTSSLIPSIDKFTLLLKQAALLPPTI